MTEAPSKKVLLADGDGAVAEPLADFIRGMGYEVTLVEELEESATGAAKPAYPIVIVDMNIPRRREVRTVDELLEQFPGAAVVVTTSSPSLQTALAAFRGGACDYLVKPFSLADLADSIGRACDRVDHAWDYRRLKKAAKTPPLVGVGAGV